MGQGNESRVEELVDKIIEYKNIKHEPNIETDNKTLMKKAINKALKNLNPEGQEIVLNELEAEINNQKLDVQIVNGHVDVQSFEQAINDLKEAKVEAARRIGFDLKNPPEITRDKTNPYATAAKELFQAQIINDLIDNFDRLNQGNIDNLFNNLDKLTDEQFYKANQQYAKYLENKGKTKEEKGFWNKVSENIKSQPKTKHLTKQDLENSINYYKRWDKDFYEENHLENLSLEQQHKILYRRSREKYLQSTRELEKEVDKNNADKSLTKTQIAHKNGLLFVENLLEDAKIELGTYFSYIKDDNGKSYTPDELMELFESGKIDTEQIYRMVVSGRKVAEYLEGINQELTPDEKEKIINQKYLEYYSRSEQEIDSNEREAMILYDNSKIMQRFYQMFDGFSNKELLLYNGNQITSVEFSKLDIEQQREILFRAEYLKFRLERDKVTPNDERYEKILDETNISTLSEVDEKEKEDFLKLIKNDKVEYISDEIPKENINLDKKYQLIESVESLPEKFIKEGYSKEEISEAMINYIKLVNIIESDLIEDNKLMQEFQYKTWLSETFADKEDFPVSDKVAEILQKMSQLDFGGQLLDVLNSKERINDEMVPLIEEQIQALETLEKVNEEEAKTFVEENGVEINVENIPHEQMREKYKNSSKELNELNETISDETIDFKIMMIPQMLEGLSKPIKARVEKLAGEQKIESENPEYYDLIRKVIVEENKALEENVDGEDFKLDEDGYNETLNDQIKDNEILLDAKKRYRVQSLVEEAKKTNATLVSELEAFANEKGLDLSKFDYRELASVLTEEDIEKYPSLAEIVGKIKTIEGKEDDLEEPTVEGEEQTEKEEESKSEETKPEEVTEVKKQDTEKEDKKVVTAVTNDNKSMMLYKEEGFFKKLGKTIVEAFKKSTNPDKNFFGRFGDAFKKNFASPKMVIEDEGKGMPKEVTKEANNPWVVDKKTQELTVEAGRQSDPNSIDNSREGNPSHDDRE